MKIECLRWRSIPVDDQPFGSSTEADTGNEFAMETARRGSAQPTLQSNRRPAAKLPSFLWLITVNNEPVAL